MNNEDDIPIISRRWEMIVAQFSGVRAGLQAISKQVEERKRLRAKAEREQALEERERAKRKKKK